MGALIQISTIKFDESMFQVLVQPCTHEDTQTIPDALPLDHEEQPVRTGMGFDDARERGIVQQPATQAISVTEVILVRP